MRPRPFAGANKWIVESLQETQSRPARLARGRCRDARAPTESASVNLTATPLIDIDNERIGSMLVLEDITSEKRVRSTMARYM